MPDVITLDFETMNIEKMPNYPPSAVGAALKVNEEPSQYFSWGHLNGTNNSTKEQVAEILQNICTETYNGVRLLMHNAKFDLAVLKKDFNLTPKNSQIDDTMIQAFLHNPYEVSFSLKPLSEKYLNRPPEERDIMGEWLCENIRTPDGRALSTSRTSDNYYVAYTAYAPPELAGPYAMADVDMTYELHKQFSAYIDYTCMNKAYAREIALLPILLENELTGVAVDGERLEEDFEFYSKYLDSLDYFIACRLGNSSLNIDGKAEFLQALLSKGIVDESKLKFTKTGTVSSSNKNLVGAFKDPRWQDLLQYRAVLAVSVRTFMRPWVEMAVNTGGLIYTTWNQVKGMGGGAKTGRLSSTPNFQNIVKPVSKKDLAGAEHPLHAFVAESFTDLNPPALPNMRGYIVPYDKDWVLLDRDYSQQEVRIEAHFAADPGPGLLIKKYEEDSKFDMHDFVHQTLKYSFGIDLPRKQVKTVNFRILYGGGKKSVAEALGISEQKAGEIRDAVLAANSDLAYLYEVTKNRDLMNEPIRTWGGRLFYTEPPKLIGGRWVNFAYKLVNFLIQGSAADCTKQAWINLGKNTSKRIMYLTVHDEFLISCPREVANEEMRNLKMAMEDVKFDLPMITDGKWSDKNWDSMQEFDDEKGI